MTNERIAEWLKIKIHYNEWDEDNQFPYFIPSGKPWRTHKIDAMPLPDFLNNFDAHIKYTIPRLEGFKVGYNPKRGYWVEISYKGKLGFSNGIDLLKAFNEALEKIIGGDK